MKNRVVTRDMVDKAVAQSAAAAEYRHQIEHGPHDHQPYAFEITNAVARAWHTRGIADALAWVADQDRHPEGILREFSQDD